MFSENAWERLFSTPKGELVMEEHQAPRGSLVLEKQISLSVSRWFTEVRVCPLDVKGCVLRINAQKLRRGRILQQRPVYLGSSFLGTLDPFFPWHLRLFRVSLLSLLPCESRQED